MQRTKKEENIHVLYQIFSMTQEHKIEVKKTKNNIFCCKYKRPRGKISTWFEKKN